MTPIQQKADPLKIIQLRKDNPTMTLKAIGEACGGISGERVRQVLSKAEVETKAVKVYKWHCTKCKKHLRGVKNNTKTVHLCFECRSAPRQTVLCSYCKNPIIRPVYYLRSRTGIYFCDKTCQGKWLGINKGLKVHPENHGCGKGPKLNEAQTKKLAQDRLNGMTYKQLQTKYNICPSSVCNYLCRAKKNNKAIDE